MVMRNDDVNCTTPQGEPPDANNTNESGEGNQTIITKETGSSWVWQYIWLLKNGPMKNSCKILCSYVCKKLCIDSGKKNSIYCLIALHNGGPANGDKHLVTCHKLVHPQTPDRKPILVDSKQPGSSSGSKNKFMENFLGKGNSPVHERVNVLLAQLIVNN